MSDRPIINLEHREETVRPLIHLDRPEVDLEQFIPIDRVESMIGATLLRSGRIDENDVVEPIKVFRYVTHQYEDNERPTIDELSPTSRRDIFVPSQDQLKPYTISENGLKILNIVQDSLLPIYLYEALSGWYEAHLTDEDVSRLQSEKLKLEEVLSQSTRYNSTLSNAQTSSAYHLNNVSPQEPEFDSTRIYIPGATNAMNILRRLVENEDVEFAQAKAWIPEFITGRQNLRMDTPLFVVRTIKQLKSVLSGLRGLIYEGIELSEFKPMVGEPIPDIPSAYIGQNKHRDSFNNLMKDLFGPAIHEVCSEVGLKAGDILTKEILNGMAKQTRIIALGKASVLGVSSSSHAFLKNQPITEIRRAIKEL